MSGPKYQPFNDLSVTHYIDLRDDIQRRGCLLPIIVDENGSTIDGHQRRRACAELGIECPTVVYEGLTEPEKHEMATVLNLFRRQLTTEERRAALSKLVAKGMSTRQLASILGVSKSKVHRDLAGVDRPDTVTDSLGRKQPSHRHVSHMGHVDPVSSDEHAERDPDTGFPIDHVLDAEEGRHSSASGSSEPADDSSATDSDDGAGGTPGPREEASNTPEPPAPVDPRLLFNRKVGQLISAARSGVLAYDPAELVPALDADHRTLLYEFVDTAVRWCEAVNAAAGSKPRLEVVS